MSKTPLRIGNAQAFWGDSPSAPVRLAQQQPNLDYLTLDYLAELSMSIMAIQKEKNPAMGYAKDFLDVVHSLIPLWQKGSKVKIVTNAGGLNPEGCAQACVELLQKARCPFKVGIVTGDAVLKILDPDSQNSANLETEQPLNAIYNRLVTANAYLGAQPIVDALKAGAQIVITGRVADPSLTVAPCVAHFDWTWDQFDQLAGATVAGHLIECGTQATGGISTDWLQLENPAHIGFPFVEMHQDGTFVITKPEGTAGKVSRETVTEQLLYEIGDPAQYLSPDVTVSFLSLNLIQEGPNRIHVSGAKGKAPTSSYKVSATYRDGFKTEGMLAIFGQNAEKKALRCGEILLQRVQDAGYTISRAHIECIGANAIAPGVLPQPASLNECMLRVAVAADNEEALECFAKELASLVTSGPQGVTGYTSGRPHVRPVFGYWPCLIAKEHVTSIVKVLEAK